MRSLLSRRTHFDREGGPFDCLSFFFFFEDGTPAFFVLGLRERGFGLSG
jgi:hypothetical protein